MIKENYYSFEVRISHEDMSYFGTELKYYNVIADTPKEAHIKLIELIDKYHGLDAIDTIIPNGKKVIEIFQ